MRVQVSQLILSQQNARPTPPLQSDILTLHHIKIWSNLHSVLDPSSPCSGNSNGDVRMWEDQRSTQSPHTSSRTLFSGPILFSLPSFRGWKIRSKQHRSDSESWALLEPEAVVSQLRTLPYCGCRMQLGATRPENTYK